MLSGVQGWKWLDEKLVKGALSRWGKMDKIDLKDQYRMPKQYLKAR